MTGLVGWWPLHRTAGDAVDLSGGRNDGTISGTTRGVAGRGGLQAYSFGGAGDYVNIGDVDVAEVEPMTVALWVNPDLSSSGYPISKRYYSSSSDQQGWGIYIVDTGEVRIYTSYGSSSDTTTLSSSLTAGSWDHLAFTITNGQGLTAYSNGSVDTTASLSSLPTTTVDLVVGAFSDKSSEYPGDIDDVRLYDRALSDAEITRLYEWGGADDAEPPDGGDGGVSYYTLDEDPANTSTATDAWGPNDGTINGASQAASAIRGTGLSFDGTNDNIQASGLGSVFNSTGAFTVSFWLNLDSVGGNQYTFVSYEGSSSDGVLLQTDGSTNLRTAMDTDGSGGYESDEISSNFYTPPQGEWIHTAWVWDGPDMILYVNSERAGSFTYPEASTSDYGSRTLGIGHRNSTGGQNVPGDIDDVRLYNRALSPAEIHDVYRYGTFGKDLRQETVTA